MHEENITLNESLSCTDPHLAPVMEFQNTRGTRSPPSPSHVLVPHRVVDHRHSVTYLPSSRPWRAVSVALHFLFSSSRLRRMRKYVRFTRVSQHGSVEFLVASMYTIIIFLSISDATVLKCLLQKCLCSFGSIISLSIKLTLHFNANINITLFSCL